MTSFDKAKQEAAEKFTRDVNGVSQSILSPRGCYEAGADWGYQYAKSADKELISALTGWFNEFNPCCWESDKAYQRASEAIAKLKAKDGEG